MCQLVKWANKRLVPRLSYTHRHHHHLSHSWYVTNNWHCVQHQYLTQKIWLTQQEGSVQIKCWWTVLYCQKSFEKVLRIVGNKNEISRLIGEEESSNKKVNCSSPKVLALNMSHSSQNKGNWTITRNVKVKIQPFLIDISIKQPHCSRSFFFFCVLVQIFAKLILDTLTLQSWYDSKNIPIFKIRKKLFLRLHSAINITEASWSFRSIFKHCFALRFHCFHRIPLDQIAYPLTKRFHTS